MTMLPLATALFFIFILFTQFADNIAQISSVPVYVQVLNINDHAPEFSEYYETYVCENAVAGQVRIHHKSSISNQYFVLYRIAFSMYSCSFEMILIKITFI